jgi:hypothetical protein
MTPARARDASVLTVQPATPIKAGASVNKQIERSLDMIFLAVDSCLTKILSGRAYTNHPTNP